MSKTEPRDTTTAIGDDLSELLDAIRKAVRAENLACYWDGIHDTRRDADAALKRALKLAKKLARSRKTATEADDRRQGADQTG